MTIENSDEDKLFYRPSNEGNVAHPEVETKDIPIETTEVVEPAVEPADVEPAAVETAADEPAADETAADETAADEPLQTGLTTPENASIPVAEAKKDIRNFRQISREIKENRKLLNKKKEPKYNITDEDMDFYKKRRAEIFESVLQGIVTASDMWAITQGAKPLDKSAYKNLSEEMKIAVNAAEMRRKKLKGSQDENPSPDLMEDQRYLNMRANKRDIETREEAKAVSDAAKKEAAEAKQAAEDTARKEKIYNQIKSNLDKQMATHAQAINDPSSGRKKIDPKDLQGKSDEEIQTILRENLGDQLFGNLIEYTKLGAELGYNSEEILIPFLIGSETELNVKNNELDIELKKLQRIILLNEAKKGVSNVKKANELVSKGFEGYTDEEAINNVLSIFTNEDLPDNFKKKNTAEFNNSLLRKLVASDPEFKRLLYEYETTTGSQEDVKTKIKNYLTTIKIGGK